MLSILSDSKLNKIQAHPPFFRDGMGANKADDAKYYKTETKKMLGDLEEGEIASG